MMKVFSAFGFVSSGIFSLGAVLGGGPELAAMATIILLLSGLLWEVSNLTD